jgi:hypothetical protein
LQHFKMLEKIVDETNIYLKCCNIFEKCWNKSNMEKNVIQHFKKC